VAGNRRYDAKRDANEPDIVDALEGIGCQVWRELPVDLLYRLPTDPPSVLRTMEVKEPLASGKPKLDKRQVEQAEFCAETGTPYVTTPEQAVEIVNRARWGQR
jgi:hypothetical protein